jgi:predicted O-methyltransferase YrrM
VAERFQDVVRSVWAEGLAHDAAQADRTTRRLLLDPEEAALLSMVCEAMAAIKVLEIGTSTGHSTLWLARAVAVRRGIVISVDVSADAQRTAAANLERAGLREIVDLRCADGGQALRELPDSSQDVVFLDADRSRYLAWWSDVRRVLRPGGLLAIDNVLSHPDQVAELRALIDADPHLVSTVSSAGKGLLLAVRRPSEGAVHGGEEQR